MLTESAVVHDNLSIEVIRRRLSSQVVGHTMHLFDRVTSTNAAVRRLATERAPEGTVVLAEQQIAGRGRLGKRWFSPPKVNLYASLLFRPHIPIAAVPVFSFIASLALVEAVQDEGLRAAIKWPNDILVERKKVAGVLAESARKGGELDHVILGIGVNLNVTQAALREALGDAAQEATSLTEAAGREIDRNAFTARVLNLVEKWFEIYRTRGPSALLTAWRDREVVTGRRIEVREGGKTYEGRAVRVGDDGCLIVKDSLGVLHRVLTGEIRMLD
jgi:BirA family transcriptional regulator, biotin operon repressor / biotin---[acetyl-CoA-carboxylase] ligase